MRRLGLLAIAAFLLLPTLAFGQAKVYTRKAKLEDFSVKITKVVTDGQALVEINLRDEVTSRWRISSFEFISTGEYERIKNDNNYYFLRLISDGGLSFLSLEKGGKEEDADRLKRPFEIVRIPIGATGMFLGADIIYMGAFLDIVQEYTLDAMASDKSGFLGLETCNLKSLKGKSVCLAGDEADNAYAEQRPDTLVPVCFAPAPGGEWCYKMLIDAETHELMYFNKVKYKSEGDEAISDRDVANFKSRHAVFIR